MTTVEHHLPKDPAESIKFCIVNSKDHTRLTKLAIKTLNELNKNKPQTLKIVTTQKLDGWTLLHYASKVNNNKLCKALIDHGAEVDCTDLSGSTPLHIAARHDNLESIKVLLDSEADPLARDAQGRTACEVALHHYKHSAVAILKLAEINDETIIPVVVENQINIEKMRQELNEVTRTLQQTQGSENVTHGGNSNAQGTHRQRQDSMEQHGEHLARLQSRIADLERGCVVNASEIFGRSEGNDGVEVAHVELAKGASQPDIGVKIRVTQLENRVSVLEKICTPVQSLENKEEITMKKKLRKKWCTLKEELNAAKYMDYLYQEEAFEMKDLKNIKSKHSDQEQTDEMLTRLFEQKGTHWVVPFLKKLQEENPHVFQLIENKQ